MQVKLGDIKLTIANYKWNSTAIKERREHRNQEAFWMSISDSGENRSSIHCVHTTNTIFIYFQCFCSIKRCMNLRSFAKHTQSKTSHHLSVIHLAWFGVRCVCLWLSRNSLAHKPEMPPSSYQSSFISLDCRITFCVCECRFSAILTAIKTATAPTIAMEPKNEWKRRHEKW